MTRLVTIRIWLDADKRFGHVSLQTGNARGNNDSKGICEDGIYVSIYPVVATYSVEGVECTTKTLDQDLHKYKDRRLLSLTLASLDVVALENNYKDMVAKGFKFAMPASTILQQYSQGESQDEQKALDAYNCCLIVMQLLKSGNIESLLQKPKVFSTYFPNVISMLMTVIGVNLSVYFGFTKLAKLCVISGLIGGILSSRDQHTEIVSSVVGTTFGVLMGMLPGHAIGTVAFDAISRSIARQYFVGQGAMMPILKVMGISFTFVVALSLSAGFIGIFSGEKLRYISAAWWFDKSFVSPRTQSRYVRAVFPISLLSRSLNLTSSRFSYLLDRGIDFLSLHYFLGGLNTVFLVHANVPQLVKNQLIKKPEFLLDTFLIRKLWGATAHRSLLFYGGIIGATLLGLSAGYATSTSFFAMYFISRKLTALLQKVILTPTDIVDIVASANRIESHQKTQLMPTLAERIYKNGWNIFSESFQGQVTDHAQQRSLLASVFRN